MNLITLDFESAYCKKTYSLSKMTTEEYVRDERFEAIGVGVKVNDGKTVWHSGDRLSLLAFLHNYDWKDAMVLGQNTAFDAAILEWHFGVQPKAYADTMSMGQALFGINKSVSLKNMAIQFGIGEKGTEVDDASGKRREDFTPQELAQYGEYCKNDVELTYKLFNLMLPKFTTKELKLIDCTIKMFARPKFELDVSYLRQHLQNVQDKKQKLLASAICTPDVLQSNPKFAELLTQLGVAVPMKKSLTTGKETFAFAKTDAEFTSLLEHPNPVVQTVVGARLGTKSSIEETRTERFIAIGERGLLPIPLKYSGAAVTHRWSGFDQINLQNLPRKGALRKAIKAPKGYVVLAGDLSNIELRLGLWAAQQDDQVQKIRNGVDLYRDFMTVSMGIPYESMSKESDERFVGKVCISEGTMVLCDQGWKPIETVTTEDKLWDGQEWVCHQGLVDNGFKETLNLCGIWLTPDHKVLCETRWLDAQSVVSNYDTLSRVLGTGAANLPLQATLKARVGVLRQLSSGAIAAKMSTLWTNTTSKISKVHDVLHVLGLRVAKSASGNTAPRCQTTNIVQGSYTGWPPRFVAATPQTISHTKAMVGEASTFTNNGGKTVQVSCCTYRRWWDGINRSWRWIAQTSIGGMSRVISGLSLGEKTSTTNEKCMSLRKKSHVYDLSYAGPRNRYTILTDAGPIIVHNCNLSLIYGTGDQKLQNTVRVQSKGKTTIPMEQATMLKNTYRETNKWVVHQWGEGGKVLDALLQGKTMEFLRDGIIQVTPQGLVKPGGLVLAYPDLRKARNAEGYWEYTYAQKGKLRDKVYGSKVYQRCIQSLARDIIGDMVLELDKLFGVALQVHDEIVCIVPESEAEAAKTKMLEVMSTPRDWYMSLPLAAEAGYGASYGDAK